MTVIDWPQELIDAIALRKCVALLGSGISRQSTNRQGQHPKAWREFLEAASNQLLPTQEDRDEITRLLDNRDYLTACDVVKTIATDTRFHNFCRQEFADPQFPHAPIHDSLISLDLRYVVTPNFDKIFETRINHEQQNTVVVKHYYDEDIAEILRSNRRFVLKMHGTIDTAGKMIFTRTQYAVARQKYHAFYKILESLFVTNAVVFIGCGTDDPDIRLLLEDYAFMQTWTAPHYFVCPSDLFKRDATRKVLEHSLNLQFLEYDPINDHSLLCKAIDELHDAVELRRVDISNFADW